ncbi:MAG: helix-turn-helix domain-containing protein [Prevotella sp.]|nr:helix-turn-helix domain-containing protein [Prevotella sp.]
MRILRRFILALTLLLCLPEGLTAQYLFKTLGTRNGLTSSQINCIYKDGRGFMWFGTPAGLYRYDGYLFKHFQTDSQDGSSLPDSYIESIQEAVGGDLWIKTAAGYCIYHPQTESFERDLRQVFAKLGISEPPKIVYIDSRQNMWGYIPANGIFCYNLQKQLIYEFGYNNSAYAIPEGNICSIGECRDGAVVVYDDGRIVCCDASRQQASPWRSLEVAQRNLRNTNTLKVFADPLDNIWMYGQGTLFVYNKNARTWNTTIGDQLGLTGINADFGINSIVADHSGNLWMGTSRHGLMKVNFNTLSMEEVTLTSMRNYQRLEQTTNVQSVYVDNSDLLWVGTAKAGVAYFGNNIYKFESKLIGDITAVAQDSMGNMIYGTSDNGIVGYEGHLASQKVTALAITADGSIWVGSKQNGLTRIKNGVAHIYTSTSDSLKSKITDNHINGLCTDRTGNLWIATSGGLSMYNLRQGQFSNYTKNNRKLSTNNITSVFYGSDNKLLIGSSEGLIVLNMSNMQTKQYIGNSTNMQKFTNNYITQVFEDSRGLIWLGTREGVNVFDLEEDRLDILTEKQGLCNNNICGIAEDENKNVWITTTNGVCRIVVQRNHDAGSYDYGLYNYTTNDGLQSDEFNLGSIRSTKDGNVVMGGLYGVSSVQTKNGDDGSALPPVMLTQLFIGEEEILTGHSYDENVVLPQALNESTSLRLNSNQNNITFKFAAGNYNQSERLQFMYWMENYDNDWRNGNSLDHGVTFDNLPSGHYRLHVKAINAEGKISNEERSIEIVVEKPWYLQWWMLVFYGIVVFTIIYVWKKGIDQIRSMWKRKNAIIAELTQQREDIKAASDELRQPMSRMTSIIMNLAERDVTVEERDQLNALHSQMLTVITRVSDMQSSLEHPEDKAKKSVNRSFELNSRGVIDLPELMNDELTSEIRARSDSPTAKFRIVFIDDNIEFLKFVSARLKYVYDFHPYNDIRKAATDIEAMIPHMVVVKQDMEGMTGSELCNNIKTHSKLSKIKVVLMTDKKLSPTEMASQNITLSADDYLAKPFNIQEAAMRFNKLFGIGAYEITNNLIEGAETRLLESRNASMTTATETMLDTNVQLQNELVEDDEIKTLELKSIRQHSGNGAEKTKDDAGKKTGQNGDDKPAESGRKASDAPHQDSGSHRPEDIIREAERVLKETDRVINEADRMINQPSDDSSTPEDDTPTPLATAQETFDFDPESFSMNDAIDNQLIMNIEQYVQQNMSRGPIGLEEMATAMGMGMKPFFQKVRDITGKTPAEVVRDLRLKHACVLLQRTNINMSELANNIGFATGEHFITLFKERFGISPSEYRLRYRK